MHYLEIKGVWLERWEDCLFSVQFCCSVVSDSLRPHGLQHTRLLHPSATPEDSSDLMSIESVMPSSHLILCHTLLLPSIFPNLRIFSNESVLHIGGQSIGVSALASVLPMNIQDWFPLEWTSWISLQSKGLSRVFSNTTLGSCKVMWQVCHYLLVT